MKQSKAYNYGLMEGARDMELTPTNSSKAGLQTSIIHGSHYRASEIFP